MKALLTITAIAIVLTVTTSCATAQGQHYSVLEKYRVTGRLAPESYGYSSARPHYSILQKYRVTGRLAPESYGYDYGYSVPVPYPIQSRRYAPVVLPRRGWGRSGTTVVLGGSTRSSHGTFGGTIIIDF